MPSSRVPGRCPSVHFNRRWGPPPYSVSFDGVRTVHRSSKVSLPGLDVSRDPSSPLVHAPLCKTSPVLAISTRPVVVHQWDLLFCATYALGTLDSMTACTVSDSLGTFYPPGRLAPQPRTDVILGTGRDLHLVSPRSPSNSIICG